MGSIVMDPEDFSYFVMDVQRTFRVTIPDTLLDYRITPRVIIDYLIGALPVQAASGCLTQREFYRLRRELTAGVGGNRAAIRPATVLSTIIPLSSRRRLWERLQQRVGAAVWPPLVRPARVVNLLVLALGAVMAAIWWLTGSVLFVSAATVMLTMAAVRLTRSRASQFSGDCQTLADLTRFLVRENPPSDMAGPEGWTRERVRLVVRGLVADELGDANFSDDHLLLAPPSPHWTWWLRRHTPGKREELDDRPDE